MRKVGAALFLSSRIGATFDAVVTGVTPKGTFVRTIDPARGGPRRERRAGARCR